MSIEVGGPPYGGDLKVSPAEGTATTLFQITALGVDNADYYDFSLQVPGRPPIPLGTTSFHFLQTKILTPGDPVELLCHARNRYGGARSLSINISVDASPISEQGAAILLANEARSATSSGDATQLYSSVAMIATNINASAAFAEAALDLLAIHQATVAPLTALNTISAIVVEQQSTLTEASIDQILLLTAFELNRDGSNEITQNVAKTIVGLLETLLQQLTKAGIQPSERRRRQAELNQQSLQLILDQLASTALRSAVALRFTTQQVQYSEYITDSNNNTIAAQITICFEVRGNYFIV
jgi:hypothetical protein